MFAAGETDAIYNMEVDGWHTYYVGEPGIWVHNNSCCHSLNNSTKAGLTRVASGIPKHIIAGVGNGKTFISPNATKHFAELAIAAQRSGAGLFLYLPSVIS